MDIPTILQPDDTLEHEYKENVKLQAKWEADMSEFTLTRRHKKVVVLILYWDKVKESYLDVGDEVGHSICAQRIYQILIIQDPTPDRSLRDEISLQNHKEKLKRWRNSSGDIESLSCGSGLRS